MPFHQLDMLLYAWEYRIALPAVMDVMGLSEEQIKRAFRDFTSKFSATAHIRQFPPSPPESQIPKE